jgi:N-methylhydantoinase A/oxoprolinase/acetone carboxylase beta subunit
MNGPKGTTDEDMYESEALDEKALKISLKGLLDKGIECIAVALLHSYLCPTHEKRVEEIAVEMGFSHISLSSSVMPMVRIVPRGHTTAVDAYLTPAIKVPFIYYVSTCIAQNLIRLPNLSQKLCFLSKQKNFFFNITF